MSRNENMSGRAERKSRSGQEQQIGRKKRGKQKRNTFLHGFLEHFFDFVLGFDFSKCFLGLRVF